MRQLIAALLVAAVALLPNVAAAQTCNRNTIGTFTYTNCSDGSSATTSQIGNSSYTNHSDGTSSTRTQIGNFGYTNYSDGTSATSSQIGNFGYTNYSDGATATTTRIGQNTYTNYSDGTTVTTTPIGGGSTSTSAVVTAPAAVAPPSAPAAPDDSAGVTITVNGVAYYLPAWLRIKGSGPAIYMIFNGQRWVFPDWQTYLAYGGTPDLHDLLLLKDDQLGQIPLGPVVPPRR